ncbi:MAG: hypothetical protein A2622_00520 [Bdellovibrionales bacterium RIFCSPHIGHO2_01_FULL_40_29]|nr:MAG: hypothetical protein A2622_00520 [Bdellovibrionales bacterium RIFCSPHIGHO2_01_FULL_40_29]OFZ32607.1 MAG: hypothetical protein A3D17_05120 [Bdellovibrionales bacterium RIFCSPHIGHO2_02_FULL_40_15]
MEFIWSAKSYREIINYGLGYRKERRPRGAVKQFAEYLRCHSTFISQVLNERAEFSPEQGIESCRYFQLKSDEQEFFLTLLARDRAGTPVLRDYYQNKIDELLEKHRDLGPKLQIKETTLDAFEGEYFSNWTYQATHALVQIERYRTANAIAEVLGLSSIEVMAILNRLKVMNLVTSERTGWRSLKDSIHLSKDSPYIRQLRVTWKTKLLSDLQSKIEMEGTRYTGVITVSDKDYQKIRDILIGALGEIRQTVEKSNPEEAHVLSIDCYKL